MRVLVSFDISDDRARTRVVRSLLARGVRVQKSVFEIPDLSRAGYLRLRSELEGQIDPATDSLRYYRLCRACVERVDHCGAGPGIMAEQLSFEIHD